jgi:hypothetical protein
MFILFRRLPTFGIRRGRALQVRVCIGRSENRRWLFPAGFSSLQYPYTVSKHGTFSWTESLDDDVHGGQFVQDCCSISRVVLFLPANRAVAGNTINWPDYIREA